MKVLNLLAAGGTGGIEVLIRDIMEDGSIDNRVCVLFEEGEIYESIRTKTDKIFSLKDKKEDEKVNELEKYCRREQIDIVVVHNGGININLAYMKLKKKMPNIKYIRYFHSSYDKYWHKGNKLKGIISKIVMQRAINLSNGLIFISNAVKETIKDNFSIKNKSTEVVYNGINNKFFEMGKKENERIKESITYIGRLIPEKGVDILVKAFEEVYKKYPEMTLTIVGDGSEKNKLKKIAENTIAIKNINFVGKQNDVIEWLDKSNLFIYPSIWEEGFGISVVEAMARGCIPITFRKGGLVEIITDTQNGYLVDEANSNQLAKAIIKAIELPKEEKERIRRNAINTAEKFKVERTIKTLKNYYNQLINMEE